MKEVTSKNYPRVTKYLLHISIGLRIQYIDLSLFMLPTFIEQLFLFLLFIFVIYPAQNEPHRECLGFIMSYCLMWFKTSFTIPKCQNKTLFSTFQSIYQPIPARKKGMTKLSSNYNSKTVLFIRSQLVGILYKAGDVCWWQQ